MVDIKKIPTCQIVEGLAGREGVKHYWVDVNEPVTILIGDVQMDSTGPCRIMYIYD